MRGQLFAAIVCTLVAATLSQSDGPAPPRLNIPGAIPVPVRQQFRNNAAPPGLVRIRRPLGRPVPLNAIPAPLPAQRQIIDEAKPVTEEPEDDVPSDFVPKIVQTPNFAPEAANSIAAEPLIEEAVRFPGPPPQQQPQQAPPQAAGQRFALAAERPAATRVQRPRPAYREPRPQNQYDADDQPEAPVRQVQQRQQQRVQPVAVKQHFEPQTGSREKKPVAQILRKYRDENEDGSITWGFENDDGSFKEESIGIDCITRGRYGYVDPDGIKREYNYETGIKCDPNNRNHGDEGELDGYIDYQENKMILPNGVKIDINSKNKARRLPAGAPVPRYEN